MILAMEEAEVPREGKNFDGKWCQVLVKVIVIMPIWVVYSFLQECSIC